MNEAYCDRCDMPRAFCVHGNPPKIAEAAPLIQTGPTIDAVFSSVDCAGCGERIQPDESITMTDDGWAHTAEVQRDSGPPPTDTITFEDL